MSHLWRMTMSRLPRGAVRHLIRWIIVGFTLLPGPLRGQEEARPCEGPACLRLVGGNSFLFVPPVVVEGTGASLGRMRSSETFERLLGENQAALVHYERFARADGRSGWTRLIGLGLGISTAFYLDSRWATPNQALAITFLVVAHHYRRTARGEFESALAAHNRSIAGQQR